MRKIFDKYIDKFLLITLFVLMLSVPAVAGYYYGIAHVIEDMTVSKDAEMIVFELDGHEWVNIIN